MTVAELIAKLQAFDPNCIVNVWTPNEDGGDLTLKPITTVESDLEGIIIT